MASVDFDSRGTGSLDGAWDLLPGAHELADLDRAQAVPIKVPGLWEAHGHLELDGPAWYRRRFTLEETTGHWTLRFGAVMDLAEVYLNGQFLGRHESPFTPFELDARPFLVTGTNVLAVLVVDPPLNDPEHLRLPHGKQGWMNHVFPSRPSLYMTYGGIWQPVTLRRHGPVVVRDIFVNGDPDDLNVEVELENRANGPVSAGVGVRTLGQALGDRLEIDGLSTTTHKVSLGRTAAPRWSPESPVLHEVMVDTRRGGVPSDVRTARYGLRTVRVDGARVLVNEKPYRMKSVLVQGFTADELYAESTDEAIEHEVRSAKEMGFNTLRLHIKAFDPRYLDVCDRVGIYLHCDLPVAEPIDHEDMGAGTLLGRRCVTAITEQVRRDRNHPSIILWSAMNELCDGRREARDWDRYEEFARALVAAVDQADGTRPVIENDWTDPDPDRVFVSPFLTAHWYGQLHADYLDKIERACREWSGLGRPFLVSEYGDWGLPQMPELADPPFWDTRAVYAAALVATEWPATIGRFVTETQRYQGLSDRLQTEVWRRHDGIGGYCLTELTDVPHELNGLLDLLRRPKVPAVTEVKRANQVVLPMLDLPSLVAGAGEVIRAAVHVANDGPDLTDVCIEARFGDTAPPAPFEDLVAHDTSDVSATVIEDRFSDSLTEVRAARLEGYRASFLGEVSLAAPDAPGAHDLLVVLRAGGEVVADNRYPVHVVDSRPVGAPVRLVGSPGGGAVLGSLGAPVGEHGPLVVGEGELDAATGDQVRAVLAAGETVLVLAQPPEAAPHYPVPVTLAPIVTAWGSTEFRFTTNHGALPSLPRRNVLVGEDSTVQATSLITSIDGLAFPSVPVVIAFKPAHGATTGTVVGAHAVGPGRLVVCQYRLCDRAAKGDTAARALLADLLRWVAVPRPSMRTEATTMPDGRSLTAYSWAPGTGR